MKKIFLLTILLFQLTFVFGQERDNVGHRVGPWNFGTPQQGITWKIRRSYYSDNSEKFTNEIEIKNTNNSTVTFSYNISENANETATRYKKTLAPYGTYTSTYCPNAQSVYFYVEPSNGQTTNTSSQQNDPTFDRNNASFQDYYKRATSAGQAGNYDEAINLWNSAIAVAVNDDQRNNARAWLAEVQKAKNISSNSQNKQQNTYTPTQPTKLQKQADALGNLSNTLNDFASSLVKQKQEKKERERREREEQLEKERKAEQEKRNSEQHDENMVRMYLGKASLNTDIHNRFNLNSDDNNGVNLVLVVYSTTWCGPCKDQINELMKLPENFKYSIIQLIRSYNEFLDNSKFYNELQLSKPVKFVYEKDFDTKMLNENGSLPALYFYNGNEYVGSLIGYTDLDLIKNGISIIKKQ